MQLDDRIYQGPVVGIGFSGQAGSVFPTLWILHRLKQQAAREGRELRAIFAFDPASNPSLSSIILQLARGYGLEIAGVKEVPISRYREAIDAGNLYFYGFAPDLGTYVESELELFAETSPSLVISLLRPTLHFSREMYALRTGRRCPYIAIGYGLLLGRPGRCGIPANFAPFFPRIIENALAWSAPASLAAKVTLRYKMWRARQYLRRHLPRPYHPRPFPTFLQALLGDVTLIPASPLFVPGALPPHGHPIGPVGIVLPMTGAQRARQEQVLRQVRAWRAQGNKIIFVGMGTTGHALPKVLATLEALAPAGEVPFRVVVATTTLAESRTGRIVTRMERRGLAAHSDWFDLAQVMPHVDLLINHGGLNTLEVAVQYDVPQIVAAPQQAEQGLNGLMVQRRGLGRVVWGHRLDDLADVLFHMLANLEAYRDRIARRKAPHRPYYDLRHQDGLLVEAVNAAFRRVASSRRAGGSRNRSFAYRR